MHCSLHGEVQGRGHINESILGDVHVCDPVMHDRVGVFPRVVEEALLPVVKCRSLGNRLRCFAFWLPANDRQRFAGIRDAANFLDLLWNSLSIASISSMLFGGKRVHNACNAA